MKHSSILYIALLAVGLTSSGLTLLSAQAASKGTNMYAFEVADEDQRQFSANRAWRRGRKYCPDVRRGCKTPSGVFYVKAGPNFRSSRYPLPNGGALMPYAIFFSKYYAIHGSNDVPGYNASHGCIRVHTLDAGWLSSNIITHGTKVMIHGY